MFAVHRRISFVLITSCVMIVVRRRIFAANADKIKMHHSSRIENLHEGRLTNSSDFRRPVPAVEEEREQAEFEMDIKFLRERQRRRLIRIFSSHEKQTNKLFLCVQVNSIG